MKILGRASDKEYDSMTHRQDLIVQMSVDEWNAWRGLTGPSSTNDFPLTPETVESFLSLRYAMQEAAKTMGMKMVPAEAPAMAQDTDSVASRGRTCQFESCLELAVVMNGAGDYLCGAHGVT